MSRARISAADVAAFQADGAVALRGLLAPAEVELLRAGIDANLAHPSSRAKVASARDDPGFFLEDFFCWPENERYRRVICQSAIGEADAPMDHALFPLLWQRAGAPGA